MTSRQQNTVVQDAIRVVSPFAVVAAAMVFFAGHNAPGGGFAAGLVLGAVLALRQLVGLGAPARPVLYMALGGLVIAAVAVAPIVGGRTALDQSVWSWDLPVLGTMKWGTALLFDVGVSMVVVGLIGTMLSHLDLLGDDDVEAPHSVQPRGAEERS